MEFDAESPLGQLSTYFDTVLEAYNLGDYVNKIFQDRDLFQRVIDHLIVGRFDPKSLQRPTLSLVPQTSLSEFWLPLNYFDISPGGKNGFYPQNSQFKLHWREFLTGYRATETVECKFPWSDSTRALLPNSVGFIDGQTKILIMASICAMITELEWVDQLQDKDVQRMLESLRWVRCGYTYFQNPAHHFLHSLKVGHVTAEKTSPSAIQFYADLKMAIEIERRMMKVSKPLKDTLQKVCAEYNRMVSLKTHRIDSNRKAMAYNMLRAPQEFHHLIHKHYDSYRHSLSGVTLDILAQDFWVPGIYSRAETPQFNGKDLFREILTTTDSTCVLWASRATQDFMRKAGKDSSRKAKVGAQLDEAGHHALHDICCLWCYLLPHLRSEFPDITVKKYEDLFAKGMLDTDLGNVMRAAEPFEWHRIPFVLEVKGQAVQEFVAESQDRTRNALAKSNQAALRAWNEQLVNDQGLFQQYLIAQEKVSAKTRGKLVRQLEEQHQRAWQCVNEYLTNTLKFFAGKSNDAVSTIMPDLHGWIDECLNDICEVRDAGDHGIIIWINLPSCGILSAPRLDWILSYVSNTLQKFKHNGMAIIIHANRAAQVGGSPTDEKKITKQESKSEVKEPCKKEEDDDDDEEDGDPNESKTEDAEVRDVRYKLEKELSLKERNLFVRPLTWVFDPETVYGKRDGVIGGVAVVSKADKCNVFRRSAAFKTGVVHSVGMLPRSQMVKLDVPTSKPHMGRALTDVQELKQVAGGTDIIRKTIAAFSPQNMDTKVVIDAISFDGWPALACLEENTLGGRFLCASVVLDVQVEPISKHLAHAVYDKSRSGALELQGFPNFDPLVQSLRAGVPMTDPPQYQVCAPAEGGKLAVLQVFAQKFLDDEQTRDVATECIEEHNRRFNPNGDFLKADSETGVSAADQEAVEPSSKKIKVEDADICKEADISNLQQPLKFNLNNSAELLTCGDGSAVYLVSKGKCSYVAHRELFSFGSGEWREASEATELMRECPDGRWFNFVMAFDSVVILEKKGIPEHLLQLNVLDRPSFLRKVLAELEDMGEVAVKISHHSIGANAPAPTVDKPLVFVLDEPKEENEGKKRGKKNKNTFQPSIKNFGSRVNINKFKSSSKMILAWRCRLEAVDNGKKLVPIRPTACLTGGLDLDDTTNVRLL